MLWSLEFFSEKFFSTINDYDRLPIDHNKMILFMVYIETAKVYAAKGETEDAALMISRAEKCYNLDPPSVCWRELAQAGALLQEARGGQGLSQES